MSIVLIYGEPGVGKTEIVKGMVTGEKQTKPFAHYINHNICIFGDYHADTPFLGTDKLSMSIQPIAVDFINTHPQYNYIIEGDRLFNSKFIEAVHPTILFIEADYKTILSRRKQRGHDQDETFLKAKHTKILNIKGRYTHYVIENNDFDLSIVKSRQEIAMLLSNTSKLQPVQSNELF